MRRRLFSSSRVLDFLGRFVFDKLGRVGEFVLEISRFLGIRLPALSGRGTGWPRRSSNVIGVTRLQGGRHRSSDIVQAAD
jgi:hypothetical protein